MMKIIIHPGLHKTGTTFLQENVFKNLENVNYIFKPKISDIPDLLRPGINLISHEEWSLSMPHKGKDKFKIMRRLARLYPDAYILLGVRSPYPFYDSSYSQYIKAGGIRSQKSYFKKFQHMQPREYAYKLTHLFDKIHLYQQEELRDNPEQTIKDICEFIGCKVPEYTVDKSYNLKLKGNWLVFFRIMNIIMLGPLLRRVIESPYWIFTAIPRRLFNKNKIRNKEIR